MKLIPLSLYQPESLSFRVDEFDAVCLPIANGDALFQNADHHQRAKHFFNSMQQSAYTFYLSNEKLLIGPVINTKKAAFFLCRINTSDSVGIEIVEFIGGVTAEEYHSMKMLSMAGIRLTSNKDMHYPVVSQEDIYYILEEKKYYYLDFHEQGVYTLRLTTLKRAMKRGDEDLPVRISEIKNRQPNDKLCIYSAFRHKGEQLLLLKGQPWLALRVRSTAETKEVLSLAFIESPYVDDPFCLGLQLAQLKVFSDNISLCTNEKEESLYFSALKSVNSMADIEEYARGRNSQSPVKTTKSFVTKVESPIFKIHADNGMAISVTKKKIIKPTKNKKTTAELKMMSDIKSITSRPKLKIHSYSSMEAKGCRVDIRWSYAAQGGLLRYWVPAQPIEDLQIISELMAIRDVLLVKTVAANVPIGVGAEDLEMIVSKGAIKRMIRSDSAKLRKGWESARYLMARCFGGKIDVKKELPFALEKSPGIEILSLDSPVESEMVNSPLGPVRMSHHAIKRVMERRAQGMVNTWAFTLEALAKSEIKGKPNSFKQLKHEKNAQYLISSGWRFVVSHDEGDTVDRVVFTAYPAHTKVAA